VNKDLETRKPFSSRPPALEVASCSLKGDKFLCDWVAEDDPPMRGEDGRLAVLLTEDDTRQLLADAARAGLEF
jgi:hypothetical protein